jgi:hypothetical protein
MVDPAPQPLTVLEGQRKAQEEATIARRAFKKKMNRLGAIGFWVIAIGGIAIWYFAYQW